MSDLQEKFGVSFQEPRVPEREEIEIVTEEQAKEEEAKSKIETEKPLTKEEVEELRKKADIQAQNKDIFNLLSEQMKKTNTNQNPVNIAPQRPSESDEEYAKRFEEEMFKPGAGLRAMRELVGREVAPAFQNLQSITVQQSRRILELDPDKGGYFKKYREEIDETVRNLPPEQRLNPGVYDWAYDKVIASKQGEIVEEKVQSRIDKLVEEKVKAKLKELGVEEEGEEGEEKPVRRTTYTETGRSAGSKPSPVKRVIATADDRRRAEEKGLSLRDYLIGIGKM